MSAFRREKLDELLKKMKMVPSRNINLKHRLFMAYINSRISFQITRFEKWRNLKWVYYKKAMNIPMSLSREVLEMLEELERQCKPHKKNRIRVELIKLARQNGLLRYDGTRVLAGRAITEYVVGAT